MTISHASDIAAGDYYVTAQEGANSESGRLKLTVTAALVSATPGADGAEAAKTKTAAVARSVAFTLNTAHTGVWKVYDEETGGTPLDTVSAAFDAGTKTLTLTATGEDLEDDTYYVSVTETGKLESARLALTVHEWVDPAGTEKPTAADAAHRTKYKSARTAASVVYTLTNPDYTADTVFTVYRAQTGDAPAAGVMAQWAADSKTLTLVHESDIPVGVYHVTAKNPDKNESGRREFTVKGWGSAAITITVPAVPTEAAEISGDASVAKTGGPLTVSVARADSVLEWRLDGAVQSGQTGSSIEIDVSGLRLGKHRAAVIINKNEVPYSQELVFTVTP